jgi:hypothetical protein
VRVFANDVDDAIIVRDASDVRFPALLVDVRDGEEASGRCGFFFLRSRLLFFFFVFFFDDEIDKSAVHVRAFASFGRLRRREHSREFHDNDVRLYVRAFTKCVKAS